MTLLACSRDLWSSDLDPVLDSFRVPTGQGKLEKVWEFEWSGKGQEGIFFGKVRENENLVPPDVRFSG